MPELTSSLLITRCFSRDLHHQLISPQLKGAWGNRRWRKQAWSAARDTHLPVAAPAGLDQQEHNTLHGYCSAGGGTWQQEEPLTRRRKYVPTGSDATDSSMRSRWQGYRRRAAPARVPARSSKHNLRGHARLERDPSTEFCAQGVGTEHGNGCVGSSTLLSTTLRKTAIEPSE